MKLYNTRTKKIEAFKPLKDKAIRIYSCGPTVYDHIHIGNLSSFIYADSLRRTLQAAGYTVEHVMNFTDVDDKTIARSQERYPKLPPEEALTKLTREYENIFLRDMKAIGNDVEDIEFVRATDTITQMQALIQKLHKNGFAYIADDGVYFSIEAYKKSGKTYGQLTHIDSDDTAKARIANDEYDKEAAHDFALWKIQKDAEPAWEFTLDGQKLDGRPGWHIECSVMSTMKLGQPFDIHTGGIDLIFPHHENEIAQSTAGEDDPIYANFFVHNEHLLVDGKKMSKSLNNFYTLDDIIKKGFDPLAFRLMVLQSHYRKQSNFTWENLEAAQNLLKKLRSFADLRWQPIGEEPWITKTLNLTAIARSLNDDLNIPIALMTLAGLSARSEDMLITPKEVDSFMNILKAIDAVFGLNLLESPDITDEQKTILDNRASARKKEDWAQSDKLREQLAQQGVEVRDTKHGQIWNRL